MHARLPLLSQHNWYDHLLQLILTVGLLLYLALNFADPVFIVLELYIKSRRKT